jgi:hypothetical protein
VCPLRQGTRPSSRAASRGRRASQAPRRRHRAQPGRVSPRNPSRAVAQERASSDRELAASPCPRQLRSFSARHGPGGARGSARTSRALRASGDGDRSGLGSGPSRWRRAGQGQRAWRCASLTALKRVVRAGRAVAEDRGSDLPERPAAAFRGPRRSLALTARLRRPGRPVVARLRAGGLLPLIVTQRVRQLRYEGRVDRHEATYDHG